MADSIPTSLSDWQDIGHKPLYITALNYINTINTTSTLTNAQLGVILIDASASDVALTLPQSAMDNKATKVTLMRLDNSTNKVTIKAATGETIYFNTHLNASGYGFFYLMGAGDYWQLMSDGRKGWIKVVRLDDAPLGRINFDTSLTPPIGGSLLTNGTLLSRTEYPWLWDHAQQSGMLVNEANRLEMNGCFTNGDGATTFRVPDLRGEFLRILDNDKGVDVGRKAGSWQTPSLIAIDAGPAGLLSIRSNTSTEKEVLSDGGIDPITNYTSSTGVGYVSGSAAYFPVQFSIGVVGAARVRNISYPAYIKII